MKLEFNFDKVFIRPGATDLRKGLYGLLSIITDQMKMDPFNKCLFLFSNKSHKVIKVVVWDRFGFWLAQKRVENGTWPWPNTEEEVHEITEDELNMLLAGIDFWRAHKEVFFEKI